MRLNAKKLIIIAALFLGAYSMLLNIFNSWAVSNNNTILLYFITNLQDVMKAFVIPMVIILISHLFISNKLGVKDYAFSMIYLIISLSASHLAYNLLYGIGPLNVLWMLLETLPFLLFFYLSFLAANDYKEKRWLLFSLTVAALTAQIIMPGFYSIIQREEGNTLLAVITVQVISLFVHFCHLPINRKSNHT